MHNDDDSPDTRATLRFNVEELYEAQRAELRTASHTGTAAHTTQPIGTLLEQLEKLEGLDPHFARTELLDRSRIRQLLTQLKECEDAQQRDQLVRTIELSAQDILSIETATLLLGNQDRPARASPPPSPTRHTKASTPGHRRPNARAFAVRSQASGRQAIARGSRHLKLVSNHTGLEHRIIVTDEITETTLQLPAIFSRPACVMVWYQHEHAPVDLHQRTRELTRPVHLLGMRMAIESLFLLEQFPHTPPLRPLPLGQLAQLWQTQNLSLQRTFVAYAQGASTHHNLLAFTHPRLATAITQATSMLRLPRTDDQSSTLTQWILQNWAGAHNTFCDLYCPQGPTSILVAETLGIPALAITNSQEQTQRVLELWRAGVNTHIEALS